MRKGRALFNLVLGSFLGFQLVFLNGCSESGEGMNTTTGNPTTAKITSGPIIPAKSVVLRTSQHELEDKSEICAQAVDLRNGNMSTTFPIEKLISMDELSNLINSRAIKTNTDVITEIRIIAQASEKICGTPHSYAQYGPDGDFAATSAEVIIRFLGNESVEQHNVFQLNATKVMEAVRNSYGPIEQVISETPGRFEKFLFLNADGDGNE